MLKFHANIENLKVWNNAIELSIMVYKLTASDHKLNNDYGLKDQIQRSSVSIASNIAEGADRESDKEYMRLLYIARGSCSELKTQIIIAEKVYGIDLSMIQDQIVSIHKMLNSLIKSIAKPSH